MAHQRMKPTRRNGADTIRRHKFTRCLITGKLRYRDAQQAHQALAGAQRQAAFERAHFGSTSRLEIRAYRCECGGFHLTSEVKRALAARTEAPANAPTHSPIAAIRAIAAACTRRSSATA